MDSCNKLPEEVFPNKIGPYKIERLLQSGGMSVLYLATDSRTGSLVVVKILRSKFMNQPDVVAHFVRETEVMGRVDHPNIVKIHSHGSWNDVFYIVMEFISGISLRNYLLAYPISLKKAVKIILEISHAISHLHSRRIIHRDLKLENILLTDKGNIKIIDFGIAKLLEEAKDEDKARWNRRLLGTPIYMSPEQQENPESVSYPSDIYSLGIIAYELLLGKLSHGHVYLALMPKGLQKILRKALQPSSVDRYQNIDDFIHDLTNYMNSKLFQEKQPITEFYDNVQETNSLLFSKAPHWESLEVGVAIESPYAALGIYLDFIQITPHDFFILAGEMIGTDAQKIILGAALRGIVHTLIKTHRTPATLARQLNIELLNDDHFKPFALSILLFSLEKQELHFVSCGYGSLWKKALHSEIPEFIPMRKMPLKGGPTEYYENLLSFCPGDQIFLYGDTQEPSKEIENVFSQEIFAQMAIQAKTEALLDKIKWLFSESSSFSKRCLITARSVFPAKVS